MSLQVLKFGGSSVATPEKMAFVAAKIKKFHQLGGRTVVVVSAMGDTTNRLLQLAKEFCTASRHREIDQLVATGEQQSTALLAMALENLGLKAQSLSGPLVGIKGRGSYTDGRINGIDPRNILEILEEGAIPVVAGFQAVNEKGDIITLGRGGSDLSAVALAAALEAEKCCIFTDVAGIYTADPRVVPNARKLEKVSYGECMEMSSMGAKVMQARSVELAARYEVPVYVASSFSDERGTWIVREDVRENFLVRAVASDTDVAKVALLGVPDVPGMAAKVFDALSSGGVSAEMIIQSVMRGQINDIAFLVKKESLGDAIDICRNISKEIKAQGVAFDTEIGKVSIIGAGIASHPEVPAKMFSALAAEGINLDMISSTSMSITCVVGAKDVDKASRVLHKIFIEEVKS